MQPTNPKITIPQAFLILCLGVFIFLLFYNCIQTEDIWWNLRAGQWIVEHFQVPHVDIFPFANEKTPWACNNEWLGAVILYLTVKAGGLLGLKVFKSVFFICILGILFCYSYKRLPFSFLVIFIILAAFGLADRGFLRPDIFNLFFIQLFLLNLFNYEDTGDRRCLWILPILSLVWFNIHLGAIAYGMPLLFIFFLSAIIGYFKLVLGHGGPEEKVIVKRQIKNLALTILACGVCFLLNPFGIEGFLFPFKILFPNSMVTLNSQEMQPPRYIFSSLMHSYYFIMFIGGFLVLFLNKKNNFTLTILLFFSLFTFLYAQRNSSFFILVCAYVIARGVKNIRLNERWQSFPYAKIVNFVLITGTAIFLLGLIFNFWNQKGYYNGRFIYDRELQVNPISAGPIKLLLKNNITGPVFTDDVLGDPMIGMGYPVLRPFLDGRNIIGDRRSNSWAIFFHPKSVWPMAERDYHLKIAILNTANDLELPLALYLNKQASWQLICVNGPLVTYVKMGEFYLPRELDGFEANIKTHKVPVDDLRELKSLLNRKKVSMFQEFLHPSANYVDEFSEGLTLYRLGYTGAAVEELVKALKISELPYMREMAGSILNQVNKETPSYNTN